MLVICPTCGQWVLTWGFSTHVLLSHILPILRSTFAVIDRQQALMQDCDDTQDDCAICLQSIAEGRRFKHCKHVFHKKCIERWWHTRQTCPVCTKDYTAL